VPTESAVPSAEYLCFASLQAGLIFLHSLKEKFFVPHCLKFWPHVWAGIKKQKVTNPAGGFWNV
jgi:hypothetical protein